MKWAIDRRFHGPALVVYEDGDQRLATIRPLPETGWTWIIHLKKFQNGTQNTLHEAITNVAGILLMAGKYEREKMNPEIVKQLEKMKTESDVSAWGSIYCHSCGEPSPDLGGTCLSCKGQFKADERCQPEPEGDDPNYV